MLTGSVCVFFFGELSHTGSLSQTRLATLFEVGARVP